MKAASPQLTDYLANISEKEPDVNTFLVDLYTFNLTNGLVFHWSSGDRTITLKQGPISSAQLATPGLGATVGETYVLDGGDNNAIIQITGVNGPQGIVSSFTFLNTGTNYQAWGAINVYPGGPKPGWGSGIQLSIAAVTGTVTWAVLSPAKTDIPALNRSKVNSTVGLSVDDLTIVVSATPLVQINGDSLLAALQNGLFDGAQVTVSRLTMPTPGDTSLGSVVWFRGTIGDIQEITKIGAKIIIKALTEYLNIQMPKNLFQPACRHTLFDVGCSLRSSDFLVAGTVSNSPAPSAIQFGTSLTQPGPIAGPVVAPNLSQTSKNGVNLATTTYYVVVTYVTSLGETGPSPEAAFTVGSGNSNTQNLLLVVNFDQPATNVIGYNVYVGQQPGQWQLQNGAPIPIGESWTEGGDGLVQGTPPPSNTTGYFTQGVITFTSGANIGLSRYVQNYQNTTGSGVVTIIDALPQAPAPGDGFTILPGCDKSLSTCLGKFNNLIHFGAQPFIPQPETSI